MHEVYDHESFYPKFDQDLKNSQYLVLIQSPFMTVSRVNKLRPILAQCIARGVIICVFAQKIDGRFSSGDEFEQKNDALELASQRLRSIGVHVNLVKGIHEKLILVDENILWEGSLNPLSFLDTSERMIRWECLDKVRSAALKHNLDKCADCLTFLPGSEIQNVFGTLILKRRIQLNITQFELSLKTKIPQATISKIEQGKYDCRLSTASKLLRELSLDQRPFPWFMLPVLDSKLNSFFAEKNNTTCFMSITS